MTKHGHIFIVQSTQSKSTRERELQDAAARSHASRVAHNRKKQAAHTDQQVHVVSQIWPPECTCPYHGSAASKTSTCYVCSASKLGKDAVADWMSYGVHPGFGGYRHEVYVALSEENLSESRPVLDFWEHRANPRYDLFTEMFDIQHPFLAFIRLIGKPVFEFAGMSALGMILQKETDLATKPSTKILAHRALAIKRVHEQLRIAMWKDGTPMAILHLAIFGSITGDPKEVQYHLQAMKRLIDYRGGLHALQAQERDDLLFLESGFCLQTRKSIFERRPWNPMYPDWPMAFSSDVIPPGFVDLIRQGYVSCDAITVLERAARAIYRSDLLTQTTLNRDKRTRTRQFSDCIEACPILLAPDTSTTILEKMIVYSIILYSAVGTESRGRSGWFRASQEYLCSQIPHYQPRTRAEKTYLAWLHILTVDSFRRGYAFRTIAQDGTDILAAFLKKYDDFARGKWPYLQGVLCRFFWTDKLSQYWSKSWDTLVQSVEET